MISLLIKLAKLISNEVDKELFSPAAIKRQLLDLEKRLESGEITEDEFDELENDILDKLDNMEGN